MKAIHKIVTSLLLVSFLVAGFAAVPRLTVSAQEEPDRLAKALTVVAKKVDVIPEIDGDFSDPAWAEAKATSFGSTTWKAVYTDSEMAMYTSYVDHEANIDTRGTWNWDSESQAWWRTAWETRNAGGEWFTIGVDISSDLSTSPMAEKGCGAFCHEYPPGSGIFHHQTNELAAYVDSWQLLANHGFGAGYGLSDFGGFIHGKAWPQGATSVSQEGELIFNPSNQADSRAVINGRLTFVGYAEDKIFASPDDVKFAARGNPADQYCDRCHEQLGIPIGGLPGDPLKADYTYGDPGEIMYSENWDEAQAVPLYMEIAPEHWADCMVLSQAEIDAGEAVLVADLTTAEITEYWDNYAALNGVVPQVTLKEPSGSAADIRVAATWNNGRWTVELKRNLVTGSDYDVQFDDLSKDYHFAVSMSGISGAVSWTLRFEQ